ncbi:MAG: ribonucleoside-diphosphate reductase subunit alpha [Patescibacteria group bacterium]|nr:ribonucleoside-diphosphate reductase subunit alpha [Patescibacteria group bacterium]MDE2116354.1 ribonucleoside-diphosphate reductase subunit alpha [Patescibacteria group bacterium]
MNIFITKRDGTKELFNADKINRSIERAAKGLADPVALVTQIATDTRLTMYDGMTTEELDKATINAAIQNIQYDTDFDKVATRLLLKTIYKKVVGDYDTDDQTDLVKKHRDGFIGYIKKGVAENRLHPDMIAKYDLDKLAGTLDPSRDDLFIYSGLDGLMNRYSIRNVKQESVETPQYLFMRIAMGLSYNEADPTAWAIKFYDKMSKHEYIAGGSTNVGAGTNRPSLSNCFLLEIHDDMEHISKSVADVMLLSKGAGGLGASVTKLRAAGSPLKSNFGGASTGPTPFAKIIDTAIRAIQRGGKKKGALTFYMENWHLDFPEFIDWKHNAGDDYLRMRTADTAAFLSDEFMKRVISGQDWYMFDPAETADLNELYGSAFSARYREYCAMAERGELRAYKKVPASEQWRVILTALQSTSHPWITWKDPMNLRALNNNTGTIHMSNLCTEICLPQDRNNVAVCNLISVNLAAHVLNKEVNWSKLEESVRLAVRQLDNLIDINRLPIPEAVRSDRENRAIGLGVMGLTDVFEKLGLAYDSEHAWDFADRIFEFVSYMAIDESADLAQTRGAYMHFPGSRWAQGMVPIDTIQVLEEDRGRPVTVSKESKHKGLNWDLLRAKVKRGMRNATLMAVAPNANIGLVVGTTPGMDPRFAQVFSRNKISGKYMDINHNLVRDLKNMGIWEKVRSEIIASQGDIAQIEGIPDHLKSIYKTSFTTSPYAFIEVAARAQKWIDQAISRNMYLETRDVEETMKIYTAAWEKGVKTTYYLHLKPRHTAEQSTVRVNKAEAMGKKGFAAVSSSLSSGPEKKAFAAPLQKSLDIVEPAPMVAPVASAAPAAPAKPTGYQSLADLAAAVGTRSAQAPEAVAEKQAPAFKIVNGRKVFAPSDPSEENLCDSCQ